LKISHHYASDIEVGLGLEDAVRLAVDRSVKSVCLICGVAAWALLFCYILDGQLGQDLTFSGRVGEWLVKVRHLRHIRRIRRSSYLDSRAINLHQGWLWPGF